MNLTKTVFNRNSQVIDDMSSLSFITVLLWAFLFFVAKWLQQESAYYTQPFSMLFTQVPFTIFAYLSVMIISCKIRRRTHIWWTISEKKTAALLATYARLVESGAVTPEEATKAFEQAVGCLHDTSWVPARWRAHLVRAAHKPLDGDFTVTFDNRAVYMFAVS